MNALLLGIDWRVVVAYGLGVLLVYLFARLLVLPLKFALQLIGNAVVGVVLLILFNAVGAFWGFHLPLNPVTAVIAGMLGVPGILLLVALKYWVYV